MSFTNNFPINRRNFIKADVIIMQLLTFCQQESRAYF